MSALQIHQFACLDDNYGYLLHDPDAGLTEVDLGLGTRIMGERDRHGAQTRPPVSSHPRSDGRLSRTTWPAALRGAAAPTRR